ncbi:MAG TPA: DUF4037 domain-containing protein [Acidothermaceae bacterium]
MTRPVFIPAAQLCGAFYREAVRPLLSGVPHAAALLGWGSDVLGYDTAQSVDHGWGPRLHVFVESERRTDELTGMLDDRLPEEFEGWPVRFGWDAVAIRHHVTVTTLSRWTVDYLGVDATDGMSTLDWLLTPQQRLLGVVGGAVYADDEGALSRLRELLAWYPDQVWRWLLACQWRRLAQEEAFVARAAQVGDTTGSAVTAARLVRDMMRLAMLLKRRYAPYQKWLGTAFAQLSHDDDLPSSLARVLDASDAAARESALGDAWSALAIRHNNARLTDAVDPSTRKYHELPARVLMADRFVDACMETVTDAGLRSLPLVGAIDQTVDNTDVLQDPAVYRHLAGLYER